MERAFIPLLSTQHPSRDTPGGTLQTPFTRTTFPTTFRGRARNPRNLPTTGTSPSLVAVTEQRSTATRTRNNCSHRQCSDGGKRTSAEPGEYIRQLYVSGAEHVPALRRLVGQHVVSTFDAARSWTMRRVLLRSSGEPGQFGRGVDVGKLSPDIARISKRIPFDFTR